jgi:hypothetical protein
MDAGETTEADTVGAAGVGVVNMDVGARETNRSQSGDIYRGYKAVKGSVRPSRHGAREGLTQSCSLAPVERWAWKRAAKDVNYKRVRGTEGLLYLGTER